ncbi:hypothetical protein JY97_15590 [Alkalispirochaeta odontotermitis]|nr:hypothetical protein JY97_15590 [Alkalispirochaeta odontotermitis]
MEQAHRAKAPVRAGAWDPAVEVAVEAAVMEQAGAEIVFVQTVAKESLINWELPVLSRSARNAGLL